MMNVRRRHQTRCFPAWASLAPEQDRPSQRHSRPSFGSGLQEQSDGDACWVPCEVLETPTEGKNSECSVFLIVPFFRFRSTAAAGGSPRGRGVNVNAALTFQTPRPSHPDLSLAGGCDKTEKNWWEKQRNGGAAPPPCTPTDPSPRTGNLQNKSEPSSRFWHGRIKIRRISADWPNLEGGSLL